MVGNTSIVKHVRISPKVVFKLLVPVRYLLTLVGLIDSHCSEANCASLVLVDLESKQSLRRCRKRNDTPELTLLSYTSLLGFHYPTYSVPAPRLTISISFPLPDHDEFIVRLAFQLQFAELATQACAKIRGC